MQTWIYRVGRTHTFLKNKTYDNKRKKIDTDICFVFFSLAINTRKTSWARSSNEYKTELAADFISHSCNACEWFKFFRISRKQCIKLVSTYSKMASKTYLAEFASRNPTKHEPKTRVWHIKCRALNFRVCYNLLFWF